jgi:hypothetical protein
MKVKKEKARRDFLPVHGWQMPDSPWEAVQSRFHKGRREERGRLH